MSQNKTIVPGMEFEAPGNETSSDNYNPLYNPTPRQESDSRRHIHTEVDGMDTIPPAVPAAAGSLISDGIVTDSSRCIRLQDRVVVGVIYSRSRTLLGDVYPLYLGENTIGSAQECEISIREATVGARHARLHAARIGSPDMYQFTLQPLDFNMEVRVNGSPVDGQMRLITEKDVVGIGRHCEFQLLTFLPETLGLAEDPEFSVGAGNGFMPPFGATEPQTPANNPYAPTSSKEGSSRTLII